MSGGSSSNTSRNAATRLALLQRDLHDCGFDIVVPFHPQWYNDCLDADERFQHLLRLPSNSNTAEEEEEVEAFLIGNTKHLWSFFKAWWLREQQQNVEDDSQRRQQQQQHEQPHLQQQEPSKSPLVASSPQENDASSPLSPPRSRKKNQHPLDSYCQECIEQCVEKHFQTLQQPRRQLNSNGIRCKDDDIGKNAECNEQCTSSSSLSYRIYWSCTFAPDQMVSMQHVAMVSGFAYFDPWTNLCVHPVYGTWHAYRAVVVVLQSKSTPSRCIQENDIGNNANSGANNNALKRRVPRSPPPRVQCLLSTAEQECARVALARAIGLCTSTSIINSSADSMNSSRSGNTAKKKACFDLLLHGQQDKKKEHKNDAKQQDDGGCTMDDGVKSTNGTKKIQRHDDDDKNDDNDYFSSICQAWIDLRDCVQTGKEQYRYDSDQLMYHFTKDKRYLLD